ncbi:MAG TPA: protein kinase, partial [Candidatus Polarisedimenticolaceae bacterium]|nr:protein kinase [Candidatus Polarisedimenticolaceae bacterium]
MKLEPERWRRIEPLLAEALERDAAERSAWIEAACGEDVGLRAELRALVAAGDRGDGPLDRSAGEVVRELLEATLGFDDAGDAAVAFTGPKRIADYEIVRELGHGGMGTVFEADESRMNRRVALKVLSRHHATSAKAGLRFEREAWIAGKLDHPHLVKVFDRGVWQELAFYSMELVEGGSLHDVIDNMKRWGRDDRIGLEFGTREYVDWSITQIITAARALDYAHRHHVIHRDVKPMNLLWSREHATVKVADFGLAIDSDVSRLTTTGKLVGTLAYMAPEQLLGRTDAIGAGTDVYALGATLFQLLTLELPYGGESQQLYMNAVLTSEARRPSKLNRRVSRDLEAVIGRALEKNPRDRYASAAAFADDLENVLRFRPVLAQPPTWLNTLGKWVRRRPVHAALVAVLLVVVPALGVLGLRARQHARVQRQLQVEELWTGARWLFLNRRDREFLERTERILALDPGHLEARRARAGAWLNLALETDGDERRTTEERALDEVLRIQQLEPERAWPHALEAIVLERLGRDEAAERARQAARTLASDPPHPDDLMFRARQIRGTGDLDETLRLLDELLARAPSNLAAIQFRGHVLAESGRLEPAIADFRFGTVLAPDDFYGYYQLGRLYVEAGEVERGEEQLRQALELARDDELFLENLSDEYLQWGRRALADGQTRRAADCFIAAEHHARRSIELGPTLVWAHVNLGASLMERYRLAEPQVPELANEAVEHYARASALLREPGTDRDVSMHAAVLVNTCDAMIQLGQLERALESCHEVVERFPDDPLGHYNLAGVYALLGRTDEALRS